MKKLLLAFTLLLLIFPLSSFANNKNFSLFAGTGLGFSFPGPIRFRAYSLEVGTYPPAIGATKVFKMNPYYFSFGGGMAMAGALDLGVLAATGYETPIFWLLGFRAEVYSYFGFSGYSDYGATIGLSLNF